MPVGNIDLLIFLLPEGLPTSEGVLALSQAMLAYFNCFD